jgi:hypothetical protein
MLHSMHVHFLIITNIYIYISCIFSKLVSQCASVRMTQFFYIPTYNIHVKVYCYCLTLNCYCPTVVVWTVVVRTLRKMASGNSSKNMGAIKGSDQKLSPFSRYSGLPRTYVLFTE